MTSPVFFRYRTLLPSSKNLRKKNALVAASHVSSHNHRIGVIDYSNSLVSNSAPHFLLLGVVHDIRMLYWVLLHNGLRLITLVHRPLPLVLHTASISV